MGIDGLTIENPVASFEHGFPLYERDVLHARIASAFLDRSLSQR